MDWEKIFLLTNDNNKPHLPENEQWNFERNDIEVRKIMIHMHEDHKEEMKKKKNEMFEKIIVRNLFDYSQWLMWFDSFHDGNLFDILIKVSVVFLHYGQLILMVQFQEHFDYNHEQVEHLNNHDHCHNQ